VGGCTGMREKGGPQGGPGGWPRGKARDEVMRDEGGVRRSESVHFFKLVVALKKKGRVPARVPEDTSNGEPCSRLQRCVARNTRFHLDSASDQRTFPSGITLTYRSRASLETGHRAWSSPRQQPHCRGHDQLATSGALHCFYCNLWLHSAASRCSKPAS